MLQVPGLDHNLLSVRKLEKNGFRIIFEDGKGTIEKNGSVAAVATISNKQLYILDLHENENAFLSECIQTWHMRLGHLGYDSVKRLPNLVEGMDLNSDSSSPEVCKVCVEGKQTKLPHNQPRKRATRPLELVHSDLMGPITPVSYDDCKYIITFLDDYTHFTAAYLMKSKTEAFHYFKIYEAMATAHFNFKLNRFRCDNGREYLSKEMKRYFQEKGISFEFTIRYTPEQNGVAERLNRTICEKARCLLLNSELSKNFWSDAVRTAVYLINRSPTSALLGEVPASLWYGVKPNLNKLKVFGCLSFLHVPKQLIVGKFDSRTIPCLMIGYVSNGYKLWSPDNNKIYYGRDIKFDETKFKINPTNAEFWLPADEGCEEDESTEDQILTNVANDDSSEDEFINAEDCDDVSTIEPRRSTRITSKPKYLEDYAVMAYSAETYLADLPGSISEIYSREDKEEWMQAVNEEIAALKKNNTWSLCDLPEGKKAIKSMWVFKVKCDDSGNIERRKARLVIKGCSQRPEFDFCETYAPVARLTTLRFLLVVINDRNLLVYQMDVKNAFLHSDIEEEVFMKAPEGVKVSGNQVCKLNKTLYGLKQAPRAWNSTFDTFVKTLGLVKLYALFFFLFLF